MLTVTQCSDDEPAPPIGRIRLVRLARRSVVGDREPHSPELADKLAIGLETQPAAKRHRDHDLPLGAHPYDRRLPSHREVNRPAGQRGSTRMATLAVRRPSCAVTTPVAM